MLKPHCRVCAGFMPEPSLHGTDLRTVCMPGPGWLISFFGCGGSAQVSRCDLSCCKAQLEGAWASVAAAHKLRCFTLCGIFLDQGSEPCPLHWRRILSHQTLPGKSLSDCLQGGICGVLTLEHVLDWGHGGGARLGREERWLHAKVQPPSHHALVPSSTEPRDSRSEPDLPGSFSSILGQGQRIEHTSF